jgi:hypothetical protein
VSFFFKGRANRAKSDHISILHSGGCGSNVVGEKFHNTPPLSNDIFNRLAFATRGLHPLHPSTCMALELPPDLSNVQTGHTTFGVPSLLAQTELGRQQAFAKSLVPEQTKLTSHKYLRCTWDGCEFSVSSLGDLTNHLTEHSKESWAKWTSHSKCVWQGCKSKAIFKTSKLYGEHLKHIHSHPLLCTSPRCSYKKPFRNQADLNRHNQTAHRKEKKWECPYDSCGAETRTFARKDKWLKHIRETQHENDAFCPFFHCSLQQQKTLKLFANRKEISMHFASQHAGDPDSRYECALGSCGGDLKPDFWTIEGLFTHASKEHDIYIWPNLAKNILEGEHVFGNQHLRYYVKKYQKYQSEHIFHDCKLCGEDQPANDADELVGL